MAKHIDDCQTPNELAEAIAYHLKQGGMRRDIYDQTGFIKTVHDEHETHRVYGNALNKYNEICKSYSLPSPQIDASDPLSALAQLQQLCTASGGEAGGTGQENKPTKQGISVVIVNVDKLKQEVELFKKKSFLTPVQSEAIKQGNTGTNTALYLLKRSCINEEECWNNFGIVDSYFTLTGSLKKGRFAQNLGCRHADDCDEKSERIEWYNPNKHKGLFVRYDFDKKKFRRFLNQHIAKQRQLYWEKYIQPLITQLDMDLAPYWPLMASHVSTEQIKEALVTGEPARLAKAIHELKKIQRVVETQSKPTETGEIFYSRSQSIQELIAKGESHTLEFKETFQYDTKNKETDNSVRHAALKTIAGFLNADGGTLLIGISDSGEVKGIAIDKKAMNRADNDKFELVIRNHISGQNGKFKPNAIGHLKFKFEELQGHTVCIIDVQPLSKSEILHFGDDIYVRDGNQTLKLTGNDSTNWIKQRGPHNNEKFF